MKELNAITVAANQNFLKTRISLRKVCIGSIVVIQNTSLKKYLKMGPNLIIHLVKEKEKGSSGMQESKLFSIRNFSVH